MTEPDTLDWSHIGDHISRSTGRATRLAHPRPVGGGDINRAYEVTGGGQRFFVKANRADRLPMFEAEAAGLHAIAAAGCLRTPRPVCTGVAGPHSYLILEFIPLTRGDARGAEALGRGLACLHRHTQPHYGWVRDNTLGSTPQINTAQGDWVDFWRDHRLGYQLRLAEQRGQGGNLQRNGERLLNALPTLLQGHQPPASLLHGDLWSGNAGYNEYGAPVVFDPAVYYGDREADLAMTELFGGFPARFYAAYRESYPLEPGYAMRKGLYNLYHVLNHLNLFGGSYASQAEALIGRLLSEV